MDNFWKNIFYQFARPVFPFIDAEKSHDFSLFCLKKMSPYSSEPPIHNPIIRHGINFKNRIGLAAGFDKNAEYIDALSSLGFGFIEVGTVTPYPQSGCPLPRLFRSFPEQAIINRMGFNNDGIHQIANRLKKSTYRKKGGVIGVNIGKNAITPIEEAYKDYLICIDVVYDLCDYITINISSPNTPDLRSLQENKRLTILLENICQKRREKERASGIHRPLFIKISPDIDYSRLDTLLSSLYQFDIEGLIISNTTTTRPINNGEWAKEKGGLSGKPLKEISNKLLIETKKCLKTNSLTLIGVGGICSPQDAQEKFEKGAHLVQIYSGLVFSGPNLVKQCIEIN